MCEYVHMSAGAYGHQKHQIPWAEVPGEWELPRVMRTEPQGPLKEWSAL